MHTKINIHIPVRGDSYHHITNINNKIVTAGNSEVSFRPNSRQIPHITLYMGYTLSDTDLNKVLESVALFAENQSAFDVSLGKPYLSQPQYNYVFLDVKPIDRINEMRKQIKDITKQWIQPLDWDVLSGVPHITAGYITCNRYKVDALLKQQWDETKLQCEAIELSICGIRGSCLGAVRTFEFQKG